MSPESQRVALAELCPDAFKAFHARLCTRFGYVHDEKYWRRDLASLEEHIAGRMTCLRDVANGLAQAAERLDPPKDSRLGRALLAHESLAMLESQMDEVSKA